MSYSNHIIPISSSKYILGDSLIELKKLKDHSVDMVFCDPPYNLQLSKTLYRPDATKVAGVNDDITCSTGHVGALRPPRITDYCHRGWSLASQ